jgi:anti-sigma regulatory factor (Ser/Thr protein kinase)
MRLYTAGAGGRGARMQVRVTHAKNLHLLELPPHMDTLPDLRSFVDAIPLTDVLSPERVFDLKVSLSEAAANAIEHAQAEVSIAVWVLNDRVVVEVTNVGEFGTPDEQRGERSRGFGLKLMVCLADEVTFMRGRRGKTIVRLTFLHNRYQAYSVPTDARP